MADGATYAADREGGSIPLSGIARAQGMTQIAAAVGRAHVCLNEMHRNVSIDEFLGASDTHRFASVGCLTREPLSAIGFQRNLQKLCLTHCQTTERLVPQVFGRHEPTCMSDTQGANGVCPSDLAFGADPHPPEKQNPDHQPAKKKRGCLTKWRPRLG